MVEQAKNKPRIIELSFAAGVSFVNSAITKPLPA